MKIRFERREQKGFSLVEVTLAMAIAAVALVTLMGMIPQGMNTMQQAGDTAIEARVHQQILNELQMAEYDDLDTEYDQVVIYFDAQGEEIGDSNAGYRIGSDFDHVYSARISIPEVGENTPESVGQDTYAGMSFDRTTSNTEIRLVIIEVALVGGETQNFDWTAETNMNRISTYQTSVVKMSHRSLTP
ncbi:MAG: Verru_Chthon cassette protein B [Verrucomicrobiota bacterium]